MKRVVALLISLGLFLICGYVLLFQSNNILDGARIFVLLAAVAFGFMTLWQLLMLSTPDDDHHQPP